MTRIHVSTLVLLIIALWGIALWAAGVPLTLEHLKPFSLVVTGVLLVFAAFNRWLWKSAIFRGWLVAKPVFEGTWKVQLRSNYVAPGTSTPVEPLTVFYTVRQTFLNTSISMFSAKASSALRGVEIKQTEDGLFEVHATFLGVPKVQYRDKNQIHFGGLVLALYGNPVTRISGHYWTDIGSSGDIESQGHVKIASTGFEDALKRFP